MGVPDPGNALGADTAVVHQAVEENQREPLVDRSVLEATSRLVGCLRACFAACFSRGQETRSPISGMPFARSVLLQQALDQEHAAVLGDFISRRGFPVRRTPFADGHVGKGIRKAGTQTYGTLWERHADDKVMSPQVHLLVSGCSYLVMAISMSPRDCLKNVGGEAGQVQTVPFE
jgi:hypothetical protein